MGPSRVAPLTSDQDSMTWPLTAFAITNEFKSTSRAELILDRANNEFGLIYALEPGTAVVAQFPDSDEPVYFAVSKIRAACLRTGTSCKKICILMAHFQLDLAFATGQGVSDFMQVLGRLITKVGNEHFEIYEAASSVLDPSTGEYQADITWSNAALGRADFNMHKECYGLQSQGARQWMAVPDTNTSEWARIYKAGKCSDFTVIAGGTLFPVHRVLLCTRSEYFNAVCDGRFSETEQCSITLPEDAKTISTLLQELYEVYNPTTGSLFTNFALRRAFEKECIMSDLLSLFVTADKYGMSSVRQKTSEAIVDRLPFIHDPLSIVDLASNVYDVEFPAMDCGLRKVVVMQLHLRLSAIMNDEDAWKEYSDNKEVLKALHGYQCGMSGVGERTGLSTPPASPKKK